MLLMLLPSILEIPEIPEICTLGHTRLAGVSCRWMPSRVARPSPRDTVRSPPADRNTPSHTHTHPHPHTHPQALTTTHTHTHPTPPPHTHTHTHTLSAPEPCRALGLFLDSVAWFRV